MAGYTEQTWLDGPNGTPYTAARQAHQETGISDAHGRLDNLTTGLPIGTTAGTVAAGNDSRFAAAGNDSVVRTHLFGASNRTYAPVAAWRTSANAQWLPGDGVLAANIVTITDPDARLHLGSYAANDFTAYTVPVTGRYAVFFRAIWQSAATFTEAHVLKNGTSPPANSIAQSEGGTGFYANVLYDEPLLGANDLIRWGLYSAGGNTLMANRLGGITTTASIRWIGPY